MAAAEEAGGAREVVGVQDQDEPRVQQQGGRQEMPRAVLPSQQHGEEGEGEIGEEPREAPGEEVEEIARQEPQAGGDPRRGLLAPVPLPEVARAFEREFGVEGAALGSPEGVPLPGAPPLDQGEEPRREE